MKFDREGIVVAALKLLERVGLDRLTMRALASELQVQAPSLYYHFPSKQALIDSIVDTIVGAVLIKLERGTSSEKLPVEMARKLRRTLLEYKDGARLFGGSYSPTPNVLDFSDRLVAAFLNRGFEIAHAVHAAFNLIYYVVGFVAEEQTFIQKWGGAHKIMDRDVGEAKLKNEIVGKYPALALCLNVIVEADFDERFEQGLLGLLAAPRRFDVSS